MVIYDLVCESQHRFEGWFKDIHDYQHQQQTRMLSCPLCESRSVHKVPSASYINTGAGHEPTPQTAERKAAADPISLARKIHAYVEKHFEQVGEKFADEARKMHYGETEERNITGFANAEEVRELYREGISAIPLPPKPVAKEKLN